MCCFSGKVEAVRNTRIFARMTEDGNQAVVYSMSLKAAADVAMVLPIPVARGEGGVKFISLQKYKNFFDDMAKGYPVLVSRGGTFGRPTASAMQPQTIKVESVGAFDASYVPSIADFSRLDARFVLPAGVWEQLPGYKDFGFAVFKLKAGDAEVHPMAFTFKSAKKGSLFFPTVHIHDGKVHDRAEFDHTLYCQTGADHESLHWEETDQLASQFMKTGATQGLVRGSQHVYRKEMSGRLKNQDVLVAVG